MMRSLSTGLALAASIALFTGCQANSSNAPIDGIAVDLTLDKTP